MTPVTEKAFAINAKELIYIASIIVALAGQWFSHKAALKEQELKAAADMALIRLEIQVLKNQVEELKKQK